MKQIEENLFSTTPSVVRKGTVVVLCMVMVGLFFAVGCKKDDGGKGNSLTEDKCFPIGAKWYYQHDNEDLVSVELFVVEKDTILDGKNCQLVRSKNSEDIVYEEDGSVYYYFENKFRKIYDFNVNVGDVVEFEFKTRTKTNRDTTMILPCKIEKITARIIDGVELKEVSAFYAYDTEPYYWDYWHIYIEQIGVESPNLKNGVFPAYPNFVTIPENITRLRCYHDDNIEYITDWWAEQGKPCDYFIVDEKSLISKIIQL